MLSFLKKKQKSNLGEFYFKAGSANLDNDEYDEAIKYFTAAIEELAGEKSNLSLAYYNRGTAILQKYASEFYGGRQLDSLYMSTTAYDLSKLLTSGYDDVKKAMALGSKNDNDYLYTIGSICICLQKYEEAKKYFLIGAKQSDEGCKQALQKWKRFF